jgi:hypothetical protein
MLDHVLLRSFGAPQVTDEDELVAFERESEGDARRVGDRGSPGSPRSPA